MAQYGPTFQVIEILWFTMIYPDIWRFPDIGVPLNHPFSLDFPLQTLHCSKAHLPPSYVNPRDPFVRLPLRHGVDSLRVICCGDLHALRQEIQEGRSKPPFRALAKGMSVASFIMYVLSIYIYMYIYVFIYIYIYVHTHVNIYIYIHIHTYH